MLLHSKDIINERIDVFLLNEIARRNVLQLQFYKVNHLIGLSEC